MHSFIINNLYSKFKHSNIFRTALGQAANTHSGGEAQPIKLAAELGKRSTGKTLGLLDEPRAQFLPLVTALLPLICNTLIVIEHNLDLIKCADWIIDLGPEGGELGGEIVAQGPPEQVAKCERSFTGRYLKPKLSE